jgi:hypothetical protein
MMTSGFAGVDPERTSASTIEQLGAQPIFGLFCVDAPIATVGATAPPTAVGMGAAPATPPSSTGRTCTRELTGYTEGTIATGMNLIPLIEPQNPVKENDPKVLQGKNNGKDCGIEVKFESGTTYPGTNYPNGPGTFTRPDTGQQIFGLGFTVTGWISGGGIGRIGGDSKPEKERINPQNPKGKWTLDQETNRWMNISGYKPTWSDINPTILAMETTDKTFKYYDHPGTSGGPASNVVRYQNFIVKVYKGKTVCEVAFHFVQIGGVIHWGEGTR